MKRLLVVIILIFGGITAQAGGNIMFEQANALYHSKNYDSAAKLYTQLVQNGYCSDDLYYNMGNAFFKAGKTGWAIWSYKKSMAIKCHRNTLDNYRLAKKQIKNPLLVQDEIFFLKWWRALFSLFTVNNWSLIALVSFIMFLISMVLRSVKKRSIPPLLSYCLLGLFISSALLMMVRYHNNIHHYEAVVVDHAYFEQLGTNEKERLPEGSEIRIIDKEPTDKEGQVLVKLSDLREGFIAKQAIKRL